MHPNTEDLRGKKFGKLSPIEYLGASKWGCKCDCGKLCNALAANMKRGMTKSCGCGWRKHGMHATPTYKSWQSMKYRCDSTTHPKAKLYSLRGITYDPRWAKFAAFFKDMGECPTGLTLDRIDGSKGYTKNNCRWATYSTQNSNRRTYTRRMKV